VLVLTCAEGRAAPQVTSPCLPRVPGRPAAVSAWLPAVCVWWCLPGGPWCWSGLRSDLQRARGGLMHARRPACCWLPSCAALFAALQPLPDSLGSLLLFLACLALAACLLCASQVTVAPPSSLRCAACWCPVWAPAVVTAVPVALLPFGLLRWRPACFVLVR
jgi:hypothetical protein